MTLTLIRLLVVAALGAYAAPQAKNKKMNSPVKTVVDASFEVLAPAGWSAERRPDGVILSGPSAESLPTRVIVRYVRPVHALYGTAEAYMANLTKPSSIPMKGWKDGALENVTAAGRKALRVQRQTTEFVPPESLSPKEVSMREEHLAVPAAKGFYLLVYTAPLALDKAQRPVFRSLVEKGFKPKL